MKEEEEEEPLIKLLLVLYALYVLSYLAATKTNGIVIIISQIKKKLRPREIK